jgi:hypothetical protein
MTIAIIVIALFGLAALALAFSRRLLNRQHWVGHAVIRDPAESTRVDEDGAVHSTQAADLTLPADEVEEIWSPMNLERLARTYWRFLSRVTLGLIHVSYTERERFVVLIGRPLVLLSFRAPEYEFDGDRGLVRWRIEKGVLVSRKGHGGDGYLQIEVRRFPPRPDGRARVHVEVEVANFYPSIAAGISQWVYAETQSRLHVIITHSFLRSLARLDLAQSRVGLLEPEPGSGPEPDPGRDLAPPASERSVHDDSPVSPAGG